MLLGLTLAGAAAPFVATVAMIAPMALIGLLVNGPPGANSQPPGAFIFFVLLAYILGGLPSLTATILLGLPGAWLARRLGLTSLRVLAAGGAGAGMIVFVATSIFGQDTLDLVTLAMSAAFAGTGATCASLYWLIAERPARNDAARSDSPCAPT